MVKGLVKGGHGEGRQTGEFNYSTYDSKWGKRREQKPTEPHPVFLCMSV